jgi:hypothetical protein
MTGAQEFADQLREIITQTKAARKKLDKVMCHVVCDARADEPLIDLRKSLDRLENLADQLP